MDIRDLLDQSREVFEGFCSKKAQYAFLGNERGLSRVLGKYLMYVDTQDSSVAPHLMMDGYWESWVTQVLSRLPSGIRCVDIGANHGYFTVLLADLCGREVFAFEPQERLAAMVRLSSNLCGFRDKVKVFRSAVGAPGDSKVSLNFPEGQSNLGSVWCETDPKDGQIVGCTTLDEAISGEVGFIKIDAEGFEHRIWAGMQRHLQSRPTILLEFTPRRYPDAEGFLKEIEKCYTLREIDNSGNVVLTTRDALLTNSEFSMLWLESDR